MNPKIIFILFVFLSLCSVWAGPVSAIADAPEITISPDNYLAGGETLYLQGTARPGSLITIRLKSGQEDEKIWTAKSNASGEWSLVSSDPIRDGSYTLTASIEKDGTEIHSAERPINISSRGIIFIGSLAVSYKHLVFLLFAFLAVSFAIFLNYRTKLKKARLKIVKEAGEARSVCGIVFGGLNERVERRMKMIDGQPEFSPEEQRAFEDIKEIMEASRILIEKEISDVEKLIK